MEPGQLYCPQCERIDHVRAVRAIYYGETTTQNYEYPRFWSNGDTTLEQGSSTARSMLARRLAPPSKPQTRWGRKIDLTPWNTAITMWKLLYYCGRCDGVFLPGASAKLVGVEYMHEFYS